MRRFFLKDISSDIGEPIQIPKEIEHRIFKVLRKKDGSVVEFVNGEGLIVEAKSEKKKFIITNTRTVQKPKRKTSLAVSLIRRERFDLLVEKAVELGVDEIIPVHTEHSRPYSKDSYNKLQDRWQRIADQALSQCRRDFRAVIQEVISLEKIQQLDFSKKIFFHPGASEISNLKTNPEDDSLFIIGPEGGFSSKEVESLEAINCDSYSLVNNILRTETAAFFVLSIIQKN